MTITDIFDKFGFPVAIVIVLLLAIAYLYKEIKNLRIEYKQDMEKMRTDYQKSIMDVTDIHSKEMKEVTKSMNRLSDKMESLIEIISTKPPN